MGPTLWAIISTVLLELMDDEGHGVQLISALTTLIISLTGFAFVDDTDLFNSGKYPNTTGEEIAHSFQRALDTWSGVRWY